MRYLAGHAANPLRRAFLAAVVMSSACARLASAQPFTLDEKIKPTELKLQPYDGGGAD